MNVIDIASNIEVLHEVIRRVERTNREQYMQDSRTSIHDTIRYMLRDGTLTTNEAKALVLVHWLELPEVTNG